jgi:hypothetical protein
MIFNSLKIAKRWIRIVFGFTLLLLGIILAVPGIPGPGIVVVWAGLAILAVEFLWAQKLLNRFKAQGARLRDLFLRQRKSCVTQSRSPQNSDPDPD